MTLNQEFILILINLYKTVLFQLKNNEFKFSSEIEVRPEDSGLLHFIQLLNARMFGYENFPSSKLKLGFEFNHGRFLGITNQIDIRMIKMSKFYPKAKQIKLY